jgi:signal transduction histidine kinase
MFLLKFILIFLIGYPLGTYMAIETVLMTLLIPEMIYKISPPASLIFAASLMGILILLQNPVYVAGRQNDAPALVDIIPLAFFSVFAMIGVSILYYYYNKYVKIRLRITELEDVIDRLGMANLRFQEYTREVEEQSVNEERKRITRELHDILGYTLTDQMMMTEAAKILVDKNDITKLKELLEHSKKQLAVSHTEIRNSLYLLRSFNEIRTPWKKEIHNLIINFQSTSGIKIDTNFANMPRNINTNVFWIIYRSIQESLTNSFSHGKATQIVINFWKSETDILLNIWDNGNGADNIKEGIGFLGMHERLQSVNGRMSIVNLSHGFQISISIPFANG